MKNSLRVRALQKHRQALTQKIEQVIATQNSWETRCYGPAVCYDNRHPEAHYLNLKHRCQTLGRKNKLSAGERQEIINAALGYSYYPHLYLIFHHADLKNYVPAKTAPGAYEEKIIQLLKRGAYCKIIARAPLHAQKYFQQALAHPPPVKNMEVRNCMLPQIYDYLSIALEARRQFPQAEKCLTRALALGRKTRVDTCMIKYQYIKRALLRRRAGALRLALQDLSAAATWRTDYFRALTVFDLDEVIYWEKAKIFMLLKDYESAQKMLGQLWAICELNYYPPETAAVPRGLLLETLKNSRAALSAQKSAVPEEGLPAPTAPRSFPELPTNYDTFQVNTYCPAYQDFIAKLHARAPKSTQDWEYIVAYRFSRLGDKRPYEKLIAPTARTAAENDKDWLCPALQNFYCRRDYRATLRVLEQPLAQSPHCVGFELAAKAHLAQGDYPAALMCLEQGQALIKKLCPPGAAKKGYAAQIKMYLLLQGIAAAKIDQLTAARRACAAALKIVAPAEDTYRRMDDLLYWELARLELRAENHSAALGYLRKIHNVGVIREYLEFLLNEH